MTPPTVLLFLKTPRPGFVKTRLARDIGNNAACEVYRTLVQHTLSQIPEEWPLRVHFAPADALEEMQDWLGSRPDYLPQPEGDLGTRLKTACNEAFANEGVPSVILLGGDCPELSTQHLLEAAEYLHNSRPVIGPAKDGGYWLLGISSPQPELFADIPWSTPEVLPLTLEKLTSISPHFHQLEPLEDVDELETWQRHCEQFSISKQSQPKPSKPF